MNSEPLPFSMDIIADDVVLEGALDCPGSATGLVTFARGSGSLRFSLRNRYVVDQPYTVGPGTLLFDLLSAEEASHASCRLDIALLARHLQRATHAAGSVARERSLRLGYFGASVSAAAVTPTASELDDTCAIETVASRGGRPGLPTNVCWPD